MLVHIHNGDLKGRVWFVVLNERAIDILFWNFIINRSVRGIFVPLQKIRSHKRNLFSSARWAAKMEKRRNPMVTKDVRTVTKNISKYHIRVPRHTVIPRRLESYASAVFSIAHIQLLESRPLTPGENKSLSPESWQTWLRKYLLCLCDVLLNTTSSSIENVADHTCNGIPNVKRTAWRTIWTAEESVRSKFGLYSEQKQKKSKCGSKRRPEKWQRTNSNKSGVAKAGLPTRTSSPKSRSSRCYSTLRRFRTVPWAESTLQNI